MKSNSKTEFVIIDVETTGLSPASGDRIIEIAALKISTDLFLFNNIKDGQDIDDSSLKKTDHNRGRIVKNFKAAGEFHSFIDPGRDIPFGAFMVHGITPSMLKGAPRAGGVLPKILDFIGGAHLVGHNIKFDLSFICHELSMLGLSLHESAGAICTVKMARKLLPRLGRYPLWNVAQTLGIDTEQEHRAMADVQMTFQVFRKLIEVAERQDIYDLGPFIQKIQSRSPVR